MNTEIKQNVGKSFVWLLLDFKSSKVKNWPQKQNLRDLKLYSEIRAKDLNSVTCFQEACSMYLLLMEADVFLPNGFVRILSPESWSNLSFFILSLLFF